MKIAIVTAIIGGMDEPKMFPHQLIDHQIDTYIFTDRDVPVQYRHLNPRTQALYFKQQMHEYLPGYDVYIWLDGKIQVLCADFVQQCLDALGVDSLAILKHGERDCVYKELAYIIAEMNHGNKYLRTRYRGRDLMGQMMHFRAAEYPIDNGLNDCSIIVMRPAAALTFNRWWEVCQDQKAFDQVWIKYIAWRHDLTIKNIVFKPASFKLVKHKLVR